MKKSKKMMVSNLETRYKVIEWENHYNLYDKNRPAKKMQVDYVATIDICGDKYDFLGEKYNDVETLSVAIDKYVDSLPFHHANYDPSFRSGIFVEMCLDEYLCRLGFKTFRSNTYKYMNPITQEVMYTIEFHIDDYDETEGSIIKRIDDYEYEEIEFNGVDDGVAAINSLLSVDVLINWISASKIMTELTKERSKSEIMKKQIDMNSLRVKTTNMKEELIKYLETELENLKKN